MRNGLKLPIARVSGKLVDKQKKLQSYALQSYPELSTVIQPNALYKRPWAPHARVAVKITEF